jgi:hypothetical protein
MSVSQEEAKLRTMKTLIGAAVIAFINVPAMADVGTGYTLFGDAAYVSPGNASNRAVKLTSDTTTQVGGIDFGVPAGLAIQDLTLLRTDYKFPVGVSCNGGAPRFQIQLDAYPDKNIFVYLGPYPNYTSCPSNVWISSGNLLTDGAHVDTTQLPGGTYNDTWAAAKARYAGSNVTDIVVVTDNFDASSNTVLIDNTNINLSVYTYEFTSAGECKKGGWKQFAMAPGPFKNQGQCVSYFNKNKKKY